MAKRRPPETALVAVDPATGPRTLSIDIGGTRLKAGILDPAGAMILGPQRMDTPEQRGPADVMACLIDLVSGLGGFDRISVGFPGVVRGGTVLTAPNLGTGAWHGFPLGEALSSQLGRPTRVLNDASVQGLGVIAGVGLECVITLGTGFGFALFHDGLLAPHLEMGQHPVAKDKTYDQYLGNAALHKVGRRKWNKRLHKAIGFLDTLVTFDSLLIGGGNAQVIDFTLPDTVVVVPNSAGITGGVALWGHKMEPAFTERSAFYRVPPPGVVPAPELP